MPYQQYKSGRTMPKSSMAMLDPFWTRRERSKAGMSKSPDYNTTWILDQFSSNEDIASFKCRGGNNKIFHFRMHLTRGVFFLFYFSVFDFGVRVSIKLKFYLALKFFKYTKMVLKTVENFSKLTKNLKLEI